MEMDPHRYPYASLFQTLVPDLCHPDPEGWATGSCPYCGDPKTFRVNLKSGRWTCVPPPPATSSHKPTRPAERFNHEA
jgi:hypothetical protein